MEVLKIESLVFERPQFSLSVKGFSAKENEKIALLGLNGSGKSTFFHILSGVLPYKGSVQICGQELKKIRSSVLGKTISLSFQNPDHNLIAATVRDELLFASRNYYTERNPQDVLNYVFEYFPIEHLLKKSTQELSYGEKRLVSLAVAIAHRPEVILLDEPFTMLDYKQKENLKRCIQIMPAKLLIVATHERELIEDICHRKCWIENGVM